MRARATRTSPAPETSGIWVACRLCGADDPVEEVRSPDRLLGLPGEFVVVRCRRCGFLYTNPQPDDLTLSGHYPPLYYPAQPSPSRSVKGASLRARLRAGVLTARGYSLEQSPSGHIWRNAGWLSSRLLAQRFFWVPPFVPGGTLVDIGSGTGAYLAEIRDLGWKVIGIEPNPAVAETARKNSCLDVRGAILEEVGLPDACADVVTMRMVLEHVRDPRGTLREVSRILKPGGRLLLSVPNAGSLEVKIFGRFWFAWELPRHLSHFTQATLEAMLNQTGFKTVRVRHLVNANNLAQSLHYRREGLGASGQPGMLLNLLALGMAAARTAGRITVEAHTPQTRPLRCPVCKGTSQGDPVFKGRDLLTDLTGEWQVLRCRGCGLLATWPQPSEADLAAFYPESYPSYRRAPDVGRPARFTRRMREEFKRAALARLGYPGAGRASRVARISAALLSPVTGVRLRRFPPFVAEGIVLDVGCGRGHELLELREKGWRVLGVEFDPGTAKLAREEHGMDVRSGTLEEAALPDESVDVVILRHVLEHLIDPSATLSEIHRILRPGGRICIEVPNARSLEARVFGSHWTGWDLPRHLYHFSPGHLSTLLGGAGFQSVSIAQVPSARTIVASLGLAAKRQGAGWSRLRDLLRAGHTFLSLLATPLGWMECAVGRSALIWVEARKGAGDRR